MERARIPAVPPTVHLSAVHLSALHVGYVPLDGRSANAP
jgi:hypothetical protein